KRGGDNLYSDCVLALDADTGKLKWYFQFTPHDDFDYDSVQVPVLANMNWQGQQRKVMLWGNRNGFFYALDRTNGKFLRGTPFVKVTWAKGLDDAGRPCAPMVPHLRRRARKSTRARAAAPIGFRRPSARTQTCST